MACTCTLGQDPQQHYVLIAVRPNLNNFLYLAAGRALVPQFIAAAAPIPRLAGTDRVRQRFGVHPGKHQHVAGLMMLCNRRDQPVRVETRRKDNPFFQFFT